MDYQVMSKEKLVSELTVLYADQELAKSGSVLQLLNALIKADLVTTFTETTKLLEIALCLSAEGGFLEDLEPFVANRAEAPNPTALLALHADLVEDIPDFNNRVIDRFAAVTKRKEALVYK